MPLAMVLLSLLGLGCRATEPAPDVTVAIHREAGRTTFTLRPAPDVRINARVLPAIEFADGSLLRLTAPTVTADSAYFAAPPSGSVSHAGRLPGVVRASICREDEAVCRQVVLPLPES
jgi:hypothetical protein